MTAAVTPKGRPAKRQKPQHWRALQPDGIGHLFRGERQPAPCGATNDAERFDHPVRTRCAVCLASR